MWNNEVTKYTKLKTHASVYSFLSDLLQTPAAWRELLVALPDIVTWDPVAYSDIAITASRPCWYKKRAKMTWKFTTFAHRQTDTHAHTHTHTHTHTFLQSTPLKKEKA